jgi:hypothetical protein
MKRIIALSLIWIILWGALIGRMHYFRDNNYVYFPAHALTQTSEAGYYKVEQGKIDINSLKRW